MENSLNQIEETNQKINQLMAYFKAGELSRKELVNRVLRLIRMMEAA